MALWQNGRKYPAVVQKMDPDGSVSVQVRKNTEIQAINTKYRVIYPGTRIKILSSPVLRRICEVGSTDQCASPARLRLRLCEGLQGTADATGARIFSPIFP